MNCMRKDNEQLYILVMKPYFFCKQNNTLWTALVSTLTGLFSNIQHNIYAGTFIREDNPSYNPGHLP
jgi:hypothetical protein